MIPGTEKLLTGSVPAAEPAAGHSAPELHWHLLRLSDLPADVISQILAPFPYLLPDSSPTRRLAHALVRHWLAELLGSAATDIHLATQEQGKPYLPEHELAFNFSHSQNWLALAWSFRLPQVGIDIEELGRGRSFAALAERYFHPAEQAGWERSGRQEAIWLQSWTRKEAVLKAQGLGLRMTLNTLDTSVSPVSHPLLGTWHIHGTSVDNVVLSLSWPATPL